MKTSLLCAFLFGSFYMLFYPTVIMYSTYFVMSGYSSALIAMLLSLFGLVTIAGKPLAALFIDKGQCRKLMFAMEAAMAVGTALFFFAPAKDLKTAVLYVVLVSSVSGIMMEAVDAWVLKLSQEDADIDYGKARSIGSITFAFTGLIYGFLLSHWGLLVAPYTIFGLLALTALVTALLKDPAGREETSAFSFKTSLKPLGNRKFLWFILFYALGASLIDLTDNFIAVLILEKGGTAFHTGLHDFLKASIEFLVMYSFSRLVLRFDKLSLMCFGMIGFFIKTILVAVLPQANFIVATCLTQAISFPLVIPARMLVLRDDFKDIGVALAVSLSGVATNVFMTFILNPTLSLLIERYNNSVAVGLCSILGIISAVGLYWSQKEKN